MSHSLGLKLRNRSYYRARDLAIWLNLVPDLQSAGRVERKFAIAEQQGVSLVT